VAAAWRGINGYPAIVETRSYLSDRLPMASSSVSAGFEWEKCTSIILRSQHCSH
jgi:hypothetical protein